MPEASTGPIRAWKSGNGWFLAQRSFGAGKGVCRRAVQGKPVENRAQIRPCGGQRYRVTSLAGGAGIAVCVSQARSITGGMARAVSNFWNCLWRHWLMIKMGWSPHFIGVKSYVFNSNSLGLEMTRRHPGRHPGRHRVADPAAHRQQGDHEDEKQMAHRLMIGQSLKSSGCGRSLVCAPGVQDQRSAGGIRRHGWLADRFRFRRPMYPKPDPLRRAVRKAWATAVASLPAVRFYAQKIRLASIVSNHSCEPSSSASRSISFSFQGRLTHVS